MSTLDKNNPGGVKLPPFPVDDATLGLLEAAMNPREHGDPDAEQSSVWPLLKMLSQMAGSDTEAVAEVIDEGDPELGGAAGARIVVMRDPQYHDHDVIHALIVEVRRLRAELEAARDENRRLHARVDELEGVEQALAAEREYHKRYIARHDGACARLSAELARLRPVVEAANAFVAAYRATTVRPLSDAAVNTASTNLATARYGLIAAVDALDTDTADEAGTGEHNRGADGMPWCGQSHSHPWHHFGPGRGKYCHGDAARALIVSSPAGSSFSVLACPQCKGEGKVWHQGRGNDDYYRVPCPACTTGSSTTAGEEDSRG